MTDDAKPTSIPEVENTRASKETITNRTSSTSADIHDGDKYLEQDDLEKQDDSQSASRVASPCSSQHDGKTVISFAENDPGHPHNWSRARKLYVVVTGIVLVVNSTIGSSLPSGATQETQRYFDVQSEEQLVLPNSIYLVGYVLG